MRAAWHTLRPRLRATAALAAALVAPQPYAWNPASTTRWSSMARPNSIRSPQGPPSTVTADPPKVYTVEEFNPVTNVPAGKKVVKSAASDFGTGAIYRRVPARKQTSQDNEWFTMTVVARGRHFATWVNGVQQVDWTDNRPAEKNAFEDPTLLEIGRRHGKSAAQVMLRWHLQAGRSAIPKSVRPTRIAENFDVFDSELSAEEVAAIDALDTGERGGPDPESITLESFGREIPEA